MKQPSFKTKKELFAWLVENKDDLLYAKKSAIKHAEGLNFFTTVITPVLGVANKSESAASQQDEPHVKVRAVINTTMIRDSHKDVHINGLWKKSVKENSRIKHLQEHQMSFDKVISDKDDLKVSLKTYEWKQLGLDIEGKTQALVFDSVVKESRNPQMYKEYKNGNVDNHSVGMHYVNLKLAINSDDEEDAGYKAEFDKHIDDIVNKEEVIKDGYFWAVYEAKVIEGSAVPMGSNPITPTQSVKTEAPIVPTKEQLEAKAIKEWLGL